MNQLQYLSEVCGGMEIRVRAITPPGRRLMDALGVKVIIDPSAPPKPNWKQLAKDHGFDPKHLTPSVTATPSDELTIRAAEWFYDNRAPDYVQNAVREALMAEYERSRA